MKYFLLLLLNLVSLSIFAEEGPNSAFFDSVARHHKVKTYKVNGIKAERVEYKTRITYYNPGKFFNPIDSSYEDTFTTSEANASYTLIRIDGAVYQSIHTDEVEAQYPLSIDKLPPFFKLPEGAVGFFTYDAQKGHSRGDCGTAYRLILNVYIIYKNSTDMTMSMMWSGCYEGSLSISGITPGDAVLDVEVIKFHPTVFTIEKQKLIMSSGEEKNAKKRSFEFQKNSSGFKAKMSDEY